MASRLSRLALSASPVMRSNLAAPVDELQEIGVSIVNILAGQLGHERVIEFYGPVCCRNCPSRGKCHAQARKAEPRRHHRSYVMEAVRECAPCARD
jgi:hypothetical protein